MRRLSLKSTDFGVDPNQPIPQPLVLTPFDTPFSGGTKKDALKQTPMVDQ